MTEIRTSEAAVDGQFSPEQVEPVLAQLMHAAEVTGAPPAGEEVRQAVGGRPRIRHRPHEAQQAGDDEDLSLKEFAIGDAAEHIHDSGVQ
ncbi:hypothetical protein [Streptomyces sp. NPDC006691]|uniref:hypothetical protein n=1 Tax=Streptomyces sp. NPDC006691 TaxID=3364757 RepID=UPI0036AD5905